MLMAVITFVVEKKMSQEDNLGTQFHLWLRVKDALGRVPGEQKPNNFATVDHRTLQVDEATYLKVRRGDELVLARVRPAEGFPTDYAGPTAPEVLERL
jgi:predicted thioredoxin/glutaredoxin